MELSEIMIYIEQYGYAALFFCLWLGIAGLPIPDEMIVMSGSFAASTGLLNPIPAFVITYLGVISGLSLGYILGRFFGPQAIRRLNKGKNARYLAKSQHLIGKYRNFSLVLSYFIPVVRHIVPYLVGINGMSFRAYATYSYSTGFLWTLSYFMLGFLFGENIVEITSMATKYGIILAFLILSSIVFIHGTKKGYLNGLFSTLCRKK